MVVDLGTMTATGDVATQRRRAAGRQRAQGPHDRGGGVRMVFQKRSAVGAENLADRQAGVRGWGGAGSGVAASGAGAGVRFGNWSRGLCT